MRVLALLALTQLAAVQALHFYFESSEKRCFVEELPSDTMVEGNYRTLLWDDKTEEWRTDSELGISVHVENMATGQTVVKTRGPPQGKFVFTSDDAADHNICLYTNRTGGFFGGEAHLKMYLDINVGNIKPDNDNKLHADSLASRIQELNNKVQDIQREQRYMREVEATFRDASETVNTRAVWLVVIQIAVLIGMGFWQMRHLKVYFDDKKLR